MPELIRHPFGCFIDALYMANTVTVAGFLLFELNDGVKMP